MDTSHIVHFADAKTFNSLELPPINLVVTSPPYPMIEMWDELFSSLNPEIGIALEKQDGKKAFELMHQELDHVWECIDGVLSDEAIVCINIGDATRKLDGVFQLYSSHARIIQKFIEMGYHCLPSIIWKKPTNSPNKFLGSGMLPPNAYVTLEHEHILIFRKGKNRRFDDTELRKKSAFFWEERNTWFSDIWEIKGTGQPLSKKTGRARSAAFPFEIPYRLIQMYSIRNDWIMDPFLGTGTTTLAAMASGRNSIGFEILLDLKPYLARNIVSSKEELNQYNAARINKHLEFVKQATANGKKPAHQHKFGFKVFTKQEVESEILHIDSIDVDNDSDVLLFKTTYSNVLNPSTNKLLKDFPALREEG